MKLKETVMLVEVSYDRHGMPRYSISAPGGFGEYIEDDSRAALSRIKEVFPFLANAQEISLREARNKAVRHSKSR